ncbi:NAD-dependent dehydratase [Paenibacillus sp. DXFW5]|uniref:NAD-dependent dehydratase n=1 Tax=Paenibacillus rhizolycopersici TaxID=2780073 RepID=A0ABS2H639_9BACL|nr:NAD-dependent epimerase/dehydratase family protein [Paenibacillus rhizolycopersici]MBM6996907.1 NAD-dependent dehydratase [Paenibacillus rhizolycopersici]
MAKILVLGGSRYFGKRLVNRLAESGRHDVTVATRGLAEVRFDAPVTQLRMDRTNEDSLREAATAGPWDRVYDNICYSPDEALAAVRAFKGRVGQYILTSTLSVYQLGKVPLVEADFDPYNYELKLGDKQAFDYGEGKRLAETALFQEADFPVSALRIPIVLGPDDYTRRLHFHVEHVQQGLPIGMPNPEAAMSFITSAETAQFLAWLGETGLTGPMNACSDGNMTIGGIVRLIENITGKPALIERETAQEHQSPFGIPASWVMDNSKAHEAGYRFEALDEWLPELVRHIAASGQ